ncbi:MAG TPA: alpha/beta hydrolase, partial [Bacteroidales bacterium]|nr:alpha/beta hydrolase [Bacteroidales bacterium]
LAKTHRVVGVELQAHGHTFDIDRTLSFEQDADDIAGLMKQLEIDKANFMGFSNGGTVCLQIGIRHSNLVNRMVLASTNFKREGMPPQFWEGMKHASLENMPQPLKDAYLKANPDTSGLLAMFNRDKDRMLSFRDISDDAIRKILVPVLVINGDRDVVKTEHALELSRMLTNARLAILPGEHGEYIGEISSLNTDSKIPLAAITIINEFLLQTGLDSV